MENTELSNIAVDEYGNQKPLDLEFEYEKTKTELDDLAVKYLELKGQYAKLVQTNKKQSDLLKNIHSYESTIKALEGKVVTLNNQNKHYKRILGAMKATIDKGMGI